MPFFNKVRLSIFYVSGWHQIFDNENIRADAINVPADDVYSILRYVIGLSEDEVQRCLKLRNVMIDYEGEVIQINIKKIKNSSFF